MARHPTIVIGYLGDSADRTDALACVARPRSVAGSKRNGQEKTAHRHPVGAPLGISIELERTERVNPFPRICQRPRAAYSPRPTLVTPGISRRAMVT